MSAGFVKQVSAIVRKEVVIELRTREILYTMVFFGLVIVVVFGFGLFDKTSATRAAPGVLWTSLLLAGTVSINRTFDREREGNCIAALTLVPGISWSLFLGKAIANFIYLSLTLVVVAPLVLLVFQFSAVPNAIGVVLALLLGAVGYSVLGTLVGGMLGQVRMRAILLPLVLFPMVIPVFAIGVTATGALLNEGDADAITISAPEESSGGAVLELEGAHIEANAGQTPEAVAEFLQAEVEQGIQEGHLPAMRVTPVEGKASFVVVSDPGSRLQVGGTGLVIDKQSLTSSGWGYLPVLAALDLVLLLISMWLFGRVMDPD